jgi:hypothetical protein
VGAHGSAQPACRGPAERSGLFVDGPDPGWYGVETLDDLVEAFFA